MDASRSTISSANSLSSQHSADDAIGVGHQAAFLSASAQDRMHSVLAAAASLLPALSTSRTAICVAEVSLCARTLDGVLDCFGLSVRR